MDIHEYQAKALLKIRGVPVLSGGVAFTAEEAIIAAEQLDTSVYVIKAQIHAGGRGKAGGVKVVNSIEEVGIEAEKLLGKTLVTHQTGPEGKTVHRLYIEEGCEIRKELYLSLLVDRSTSRIVILASTEGGIDIEEVADNTPEKITAVVIDPAIGFQPFHGREIAVALELKGKQTQQMVKMLYNMYNAFVDWDASSLEINPLIITKHDDILPLDAKMSFDDNALYRHPRIEELKDSQEEDPAEHRAKTNELSYIKLDGNIGCLVNGAGLAMATMDAIKHHGGEPANFLDVGGGAPKERVAEAFKIILSDDNVKGILVNIFGGIMRCDIIAEGIIAATKELGLEIPLVVRLAGTNVDLGKELLEKSGLNIIAADDLGDASDKIVSAVKEVETE